MIGRLKGVVEAIGDDAAIIDVHGVGYEVYCPARVLGNLPAAGEAVTLTIETVVREDMIRLYGFASETERQWFRLLQSVQGVGAKVALAVLGVLSGDELTEAIAIEDTRPIVRAPGVGKRVAERIVAELKDKVGSVMATGADLSFAATPVARRSADPEIADAVSALVNLGYAEPEVRKAVAKAREDGAANTAELIRTGLKTLSER
ncbi:Holliday junction branch migration protein RuvA [Amorphus orientalis]|uniref:Holliday junction branch migration complex subunit RuvA n=1 Tax=Amorphus orientalis TaxID=649198 RepID=A0AAE3VQL0_9HYPH|nr:Holliday junction branch migration protein RuvA [Amorphus orientalis]MDQ0316143.1 Holliday junction DNA helicase RuvA [Amorphus orientalis]